MKKIIPIFLALIVFIAALFMLRPEATVTVLAASRDLPAGYQVSSEDLRELTLPQSLAPSEAFTDPALVVGQVLSVPRAAGDILYPQNLGGETLTLAADERAVAIQVSNSAGLAGMLAPGDRVGVTAVIYGDSGQGAYSKTVIEGLRVLYISPDFLALDPETSADENEASSGFAAAPSSQRERTDTGTVVLAVPVESQILAYDFSFTNSPSEARSVYAIDLLPALDHAQNVELSLFLVPEDPEAFITSGIYLPDLVITPGASPTPTGTPLPGMVLATPTAAVP